MLEFKSRGKTISAALDAGLKKLGLEAGDVRVRVLRQAKNFMDAEILIVVDDAMLEKNPHLRNVVPEGAPKTDFEKLLAKASKTASGEVVETQAASAPEFVQKFVKVFLAEAGFRRVVVALQEDEFNLNVSASARGLLSVKPSPNKVIQALQNILSDGVRQRFGLDKRVYVDFNGLKKRRQEKVIAIAVKACEDVLSGAEEVKLEPMNAFERRLVHSEVAKFEGLGSRSEGEEPQRYVIISR